MKPVSPLKAIRLNCLDCSGGSANEVKLCPVVDCQLFPFRLEKTRIGNQCRKKGGRNAENDSKIDAKQSGPDKYKGENRG